MLDLLFYCAKINASKKQQKTRNLKMKNSIAYKIAFTVFALLVAFLVITPMVALIVAPMTIANILVGALFGGVMVYTVVFIIWMEWN